MILRILSFTILLLLIITTSVFGQISDINKTTGWYMTNECFQGQVDVNQTPYTGAELDLTPFSGFTNSSEYYGGFFQGYYLYCDLDNDGFNNFVRFMYKSPWPNEDRGIIVHSRRGLTTDDYTVRYGLTEPRKEVVTDFNNDGIKEVLLFSQGLDTDPFPGDSIMLYHIDGDSAQYFDNVSFYHGGAVGDIDNDGDQDIITGFNKQQSNRFVRAPEVYINDGDFNFRADNSMFLNFSEDRYGWFTVELHDLDDDGYLDLLFFDNINGQYPSLNIVYNEDGFYDYEKRYIIDVSPYDNEGFIGDIDFYDLNNDSQVDIILSFGYKKYQSLVYLRDDQDYIDATNTYIEPSSIDDNWVLWNFLKDIDGDGDIDIIPDGSQNRFFYLENNNGVFQKVDSTPITSSNSLVRIITLSSPKNESTGVTLTPTLSWSEDTNSDSYTLQVSTDGFESFVVNESVSETSFTTSDLGYNTTYSWRVRGTNSSGDGDYSEVWTFTTQYRQLSSSTPLNPQDGQDNVGTLTDFNWSEEDSVESYHLQVSTESSFSTLSFESTDLDSTSYTLTEPLEQNTQYYWRVRSLGEVEQQHSEWSEAVYFTTGVRTSVEEVVPTEHSLNQNYPNPFNPTTTITYSLPQSGMVTLNVYDITGRYITTLVNGVIGVGTHTVQFEGSSLSSGMYVYTLQTDGYRQTRQMMLVK